MNQKGRMVKEGVAEKVVTAKNIERGGEFGSCGKN